MDIETFKKEAHAMVDWIADYYQDIEKYPVKSQVKPKEILNQLPNAAPEKSEDISTIMNDFQKILLPGITHWQSPNFFAYFPANSSYPSVLAEMLTATLGAQCMIWETSPAAAELEEKVMDWLKKMMGLPENWYGAIQDTASSATLCAILSAREKATGFEINSNGFSTNDFCIYCSTQTHSSIDKAVKIAGIGKNNLIKIAVDENLALVPDILEKNIKDDIARGKKPLCVIATIGTTGTTAIDPVKEIAQVCRKYNVWLHVDAAFAGTALILPEMRRLAEGLEMVDSYVFNPHKWMFTNFDCSAYFVKDRETLIRTFEIMPEYLKTAVDSQVNNYRDWGIALGRRFRALKLWFVIRSFGVDGIRERIRNHIKMAQELVEKIKTHGSFEILAPVPLNVICFRFKPENLSNEDELNLLNENLLKQLNASGKVYMTHTKIDGKYTIRMVIGQTYVKQIHVDSAWALIKQTANIL